LAKSWLAKVGGILHERLTADCEHIWVLDNTTWSYHALTNGAVHLQKYREKSFRETSLVNGKEGVERWQA